jgi:hypothetical protein
MFSDPLNPLLDDKSSGVYPPVTLRAGTTPIIPCSEGRVRHRLATALGLRMYSDSTRAGTPSFLSEGCQLAVSCLLENVLCSLKVKPQALTLV